MIHDEIMKVLESAVGQQANDLADALFRNIMPDGKNTLHVLRFVDCLDKGRSEIVYINLDDDVENDVDDDSVVDDDCDDDDSVVVDDVVENGDVDNDVDDNNVDDDDDSDDGDIVVVLVVVVDDYDDDNDDSDDDSIDLLSAGLMDIQRMVSEV
jgi:hypothetical protein